MAAKKARCPSVATRKMRSASLSDFRVVPFGLASKEAAIGVWAKGGNEDIFKFMAAEARFVFGNRQARNALGFQLIGGCKKFIPGLGWFFKAGGFQFIGAIPEYVGAMNIHRHRPGFAIH